MHGSVCFNNDLRAAAAIHTYFGPNKSQTDTVFHKPKICPLYDGYVGGRLFGSNIYSLMVVEMSAFDVCLAVCVGAKLFSASFSNILHCKLIHLVVTCQTRQTYPIPSYTIYFLSISFRLHIDGSRTKHSQVIIGAQCVSVSLKMHSGATMSIVKS